MNFKNVYNTCNINLNRIKIKEAPNANLKFLHLFRDKINERTTIYTDGSKIINNTNSSVSIANWSPNVNFVVINYLTLLQFTLLRRLPY